VLIAPREARFARFRERFDGPAFRKRLAEAEICWLARSDPAFPHALTSIFDPPAGLFVRRGGGSELFDRPAVAIVGARACSPYGLHVARTFGRELAAAGLVVVSGMARGVDGEAHRGALDAGGVTVAVLGCGVDRDYPAVHAELARRICADGLVVSEYAPASSRLRGASLPGNEEGGRRADLVNQVGRTCRTSAKCAAGVVPVWSRNIAIPGNGAGFTPG
jgi:DNA processing protein